MVRDVGGRCCHARGGGCGLGSQGLQRTPGQVLRPQGEGGMPTAWGRGGGVGGMGVVTQRAKSAVGEGWG